MLSSATEVIYYKLPLRWHIPLTFAPEPRCAVLNTSHRAGEIRVVLSTGIISLVSCENKKRKKKTWIRTPTLQRGQFVREKYANLGKNRTRIKPSTRKLINECKRAAARTVDKFNKILYDQFNLERGTKALNVMELGNKKKKFSAPRR